MNALEQLERLRREAVERARVALVEAQRRAEQQDAALRAARHGEQVAEAELRRARLDYAAAHSVLELRAGDQRVQVLRLAWTHRQEARQRCERAHAEARAAVSERERVVREAELGRRAVERRLAQHAADVGRRTERQREDELDDTFRGLRTRGSLA